MLLLFFALVYRSKLANLAVAEVFKSETDGQIPAPDWMDSRHGYKPPSN